MTKKPRRPRNLLKSLLAKPDKIRTYYKYEYRSMKQFAKDFGVCRYTMYKVLKKLDLPLPGKPVSHSVFAPVMRATGVKSKDIIEHVKISKATLYALMTSLVPTCKLRTGLLVLESLGLYDDLDIDFFRTLYKADSEELRAFLDQKLKDLNIPLVYKHKNSSLKKICKLADIPYPTLFVNVKRRTSISIKTALKLYDFFYPGRCSYTTEILRALIISKRRRKTDETLL